MPIPLVFLDKRRVFELLLGDPSPAGRLRLTDPISIVLPTYVYSEPTPPHGQRDLRKGALVVGGKHYKPSTRLPLHHRADARAAQIIFAELESLGFTNVDIVDVDEASQRQSVSAAHRTCEIVIDPKLNQRVHELRASNETARRLFQIENDASGSARMAVARTGAYGIVTPAEESDRRYRDEPENRRMALMIAKVVQGSHATLIVGGLTDASTVPAAEYLTKRASEIGAMNDPSRGRAVGDSSFAVVLSAIRNGSGSMRVDVEDVRIP